MTDTSRDMAALIRQLESLIDAGADGLPEELFLFVSRITPLVNVDLLIQDDSRRTLLTWRSDRFFGSGWHVPGGIVRIKEAAAHRVHAVARVELGAAVTFDPVPILVEEKIRPAWPERGHTVSLLYRCRLANTLDPRLRYTPEAPMPDQWLWHERCPENLIRDHRSYAGYMG